MFRRIPTDPAHPYRAVLLATLATALGLLAPAAPAGAQSPDAGPAETVAADSRWGALASGVAKGLEAAYDPGSRQFPREHTPAGWLGLGSLSAPLAALLAAAPAGAAESWQRRPRWKEELNRPFSVLTAWRVPGVAPASAPPDSRRLAMLEFARSGEPFWATVWASTPEESELPEAETDWPAGTWGLPQARATLEAVALATSVASAAAEAKRRVARLRSLVRTGPADYFLDKGTVETARGSGAPEPRAMAALALLEASRTGLDPEALAPGLEHVQLLLDRHLDGWAGYSHLAEGDLPVRQWGPPRSGLRAQALVIHALQAAGAGGGRLGARAREAASRLKRRLLAQGRDPASGLFLTLEFELGGGEKQPRVRPGCWSLPDQFWALLAFHPTAVPWAAVTRGGQ